MIAAKILSGNSNNSGSRALAWRPSARAAIIAANEKLHRRAHLDSRSRRHTRRERAIYKLVHTSDVLQMLGVPQSQRQAKNALQNMRASARQRVRISYRLPDEMSKTG